MRDLNSRFTEAAAFALIGAFIVVSGALALSYEVIWARKLVPLFGSDAVSVAVVVALFMFGLGLGAHLAGRLGDRLARPLGIYALLEIGLGAWVVLTPWLIGWLSAGLVAVAGVLGSDGSSLTILRVVAGGLLLLPPTLVMGASLPLLARFAVHVAGRPPGQVISWYTLNLVGAVSGVFLAGFVLLPTFAMSPLLWLAGLVNMLLGLCLWFLARYWERNPALDGGALTDVARAATERNGLTALPWMAMSALIGLASMICQIAWTRTIVLVVGGSAYAFSAVLGVFLAGLGLGAWLASSALKRWPTRAVELYVLLGFAALLALFLSLYLLPLVPGWFLQAFEPDSLGQTLGVFLLQAGTAASLFLMPALLMGALFPLLLRQVLEESPDTALVTSRVYLANTFGCVIGALLAGLWLIPTLGIPPTLVLAIGLLCYALLLALPRLPRVRQRLSAGLGMLLVFSFGWWSTPPWNSQLMSAGISEYAQRFAGVSQDQLADHLADQFDLLFYRDGPTATISVSRERWSLPRHLFISTNGKVDGSSWGDMPTQQLSAHLPLLLHPEPEQVAIVGMGTGVTAGAATLHDSVNAVTLLEIEPAMVEGARLFAEVNHGIHDNPDVSIRVIDGRFYLSLVESQYDVIVSVPSNPWIAGVASLFTEEFYRLGARALTDGGVFAQWIQLYDISADNLQAVMHTFNQVFPYSYGAVTIVGADLLLVGSMQPIKIDPATIEQRMLAQPELQQDLAASPLAVADVWDLLARIWLAPEGIRALAGGARTHRDDWPFLMYEAPLSRYSGGRDRNMELLSAASGGLDGWFLSPLTESERSALAAARRSYVPAPLAWWVED